MNGQRETANAFLVNGGDVSEGRNLGAGLVPNLDSIEEFRLITNSFDAEYGKFSGAVINAITKSGTNGFHGDAFEFLRNDHLDAKNYFAPSKSELRRNQFGYAAGGPFWKNKLFWFSDYQGTRQVQARRLALFRYRRQTSVKASLTLLHWHRTAVTVPARPPLIASMALTGRRCFLSVWVTRSRKTSHIALSGAPLTSAVRVSERRDSAGRLFSAGRRTPRVYSCADASGRYEQLLG